MQVHDELTMPMLMEQLINVVEEIYEMETIFKSFAVGDPKLEQIESDTAFSNNIRKNEQLF
jgi:hypothetical protein